MMGEDCRRYQYLLGGIRLSPDADDGEVLECAAKKMKRLGVSARSLHFRLYKRSIDARKRDDVKLVWTVLVESLSPLSASVCQKGELRALKSAELDFSCGNENLSAPPLVVGMGPAGMFAALLLARRGYRPILIDRGDCVEERAEAVERFRLTGVLDAESNVQFGAGGAGTFSDGKLVTRVHDPRCQLVLETFCHFGAPKEILTLAKPHIGTDVLRDVVSGLLSEIERLGGRVIYRCRLLDFEERQGGEIVAHTSAGDLCVGAVILAVGHSARDTYKQLIADQFAIEAKPISVGVRVEHLQEDIDRALYGDFAGHPRLGPAEYTLSDTRTERGVYTFCMCPGGEVVAAASEHEGLVVNGMSYHARDGKNANAAVLVSVGTKDFEPINGNLALGAIEFQRRIERNAFRAGGGAYVAPVMRVDEFLHGKRMSECERISPSYRDGMVKSADFREVFPSFVTDSLRYALNSFGGKIEGYDAPDAILTAAETRTSAPLRILRDPETLTAIGHPLVYPCGEGAGYAGGITSAAIDGIRIAEAIMGRFAPSEKE